MDALVGPHTGETGYGRMGCTFCHRAFEINAEDAIDPNFTSYLNTSPKVHAGQTLPCLYCHSGSKKGTVTAKSHKTQKDNCDCHINDPDYPPIHGETFTDMDDCLKCHGMPGTRIKYIPPAKGLGVTTNSSDTGERSAHTKFVLDARNNMAMLEDANEACLGCHTRTGVNITWTRNSHVSYHVTCDKSGYNVTWNTSDNLGTNETMFDSSSGWDW